MRHKWNRKQVRRWEAAACVKCGLIKEIAEGGKLFYFGNDNAMEKAGTCPGVPTYNIYIEKPKIPGSALCRYGNAAYDN